MARVEMIAVETAWRGTDQIRYTQGRYAFGFMPCGVAFQPRDQVGSCVQPPTALA